MSKNNRGKAAREEKRGKAKERKKNAPSTTSWRIERSFSLDCCFIAKKKKKDFLGLGRKSETRKKSKRDEKICEFRRLLGLLFLFVHTAKRLWRSRTKGESHFARACGGKEKSKAEQEGERHKDFSPSLCARAEWLLYAKICATIFVCVILDDEVIDIVGDLVQNEIFLDGWRCVD